MSVYRAVKQLLAGAMALSGAAILTPDGSGNWIEFQPSPAPLVDQPRYSRPAERQRSYANPAQEPGAYGAPSPAYGEPWIYAPPALQTTPLPKIMLYDGVGNWIIFGPTEGQ